MKARFFATVLVLSTASAGVPTAAVAQATSDEATTKMARARFKEGVSYYDKGDYELARASFLQAYALKKHPAVLLNMAWSCLKSGHTLEGARYFKQFLAESKDISDKQRADANDGVTQARAKLGQIEVTAPVGAEVTVDNDRVGLTPLSDPVLVEIGTHSVRMRASDGTTETQSITVLGGEKASARFTRAAATGPATVPQVAPPTASSSFPAPVAANPVPAPGPPPNTPEATKPAEPLPNEPPAPVASGSMSLLPSFIGYGLAAASGVVSYLALTSIPDARRNANSTGDQILSKGGMCPPPATGPTSTPPFVNACKTYSDDLNLITTDRTIGWVFLGTGAGLFVASTVYLVVGIAHNAHSNAPPATVAVTPIVGPSLSGLAVSGTF